MDEKRLASLTSISSSQKEALRRGGVHTVSDLLLSPVDQTSRSTRLTVSELKTIIAEACRESFTAAQPLKEIYQVGGEKFTTGDPPLDAILGGGIRTRMLWEVAGESAAGKTQFALQLSLMVQLPLRLGGLAGSACYLTTSLNLPTSRLIEMQDAHPLLSPSFCDMDDIQTMMVPTILTLTEVLTNRLPVLIEARSNNTSLKPVKLIVIDALAELFHDMEQYSTETLVARAKSITEISLLLHSLASKYQLALLVLNEVVDVFDYDLTPDPRSGGELTYREQSRWFQRAESTPGEGRKMASLGLVWANQVNARIILSRTERRRYLEKSPRPEKRQRRTNALDVTSNLPSNVDSSLVIEQATLIRRLSIVFSSVSLPASLDYVVTAGGITTLRNETALEPSSSTSSIQNSQRDVDDVATQTIQSQSNQEQVSLLDIGSTENVGVTDTSAPDGIPDEDEWDIYWREDSITEDMYNAVDLGPQESH